MNKVFAIGALNTSVYTDVFDDDFISQSVMEYTTPIKVKHYVLKPNTHKQYLCLAGLLSVINFYYTSQIAKIYQPMDICYGASLFTAICCIFWIFTSLEPDVSYMGAISLKKQIRYPFMSACASFLGGVAFIVQTFQYINNTYLICASLFLIAPASIKIEKIQNAGQVVVAATFILSAGIWFDEDIFLLIGIIIAGIMIGVSVSLVN